MKIIVHRRNTIEQLESVPLEHGVEVDVRSRGSRLIAAHDPFCEGPDLEEWLKSFRHGTLIFNVKESGIEPRIQEAARSRGIADYFFLDLAAPDLVKLIASGEKRAAVRFSEYEPLEAALAFAGKTEWVWVDCFSRLPLSEDSYSKLARYFKICVVSPELHGRDAAEISSYKEMLRPHRIDAVCTKRPDLWLENRY